MSHRIIRCRRFAAALALAATVTSCGYSVGYDREASAAGAGMHTVGVQVVGNRTFRQRLEIPITRQLQEALPLHTGLTPTSPERADTVLQVDLVDVQGLSLLQGAVHPITEGGLRFRVEVKLYDRRTGALLRQRQITDISEFRSPIGENQGSALTEAAADLARKIALALEADF